MGRYRVKGVITVFFSLTSVLILSLICTSLESARIQGARAQTANITDMGNYSVFGEYEKKLLEKYELFSVDGSYGTGDFSIERVNDRLQSYLKKNASPNGEGLAGLCFDPWNLQPEGSEIHEYALLSDQNGEVFYQQAVSYMKKTAVSSGIGKLIEYYQDATKAQDQENEYEKKKNASDLEMKELEKQESEKKQEMEEGQKGSTVSAGSTMPAAETENPLKMLNRLRKKSLLQLVCGDGEISEKKVSKKELYSKRSNQKGTMKIEKEHEGLISDLLFREYLLDHFSNYRSGLAEGGLSYQIEYVIAGNKGDKENLKSVVRRLLLIREGMNYLYCVQDSEMNAETGSLASLLVGWTGIPALVSVLKHALLLGWAYGESLLDVRTLLGGGKIPLLKSEVSWVLTLDHLGQLEDLLTTGKSDNREGLSYRDYLRILLNLQSVSEQKKRGLDMVELTMKSVAGLSNFRVDHCVVGIREQTNWKIRPIFLRVPEAFLGVSQTFTSVKVSSGFAYH